MANAHTTDSQRQCAHHSSAQRHQDALSGRTAETGQTAHGDRIRPLWPATKFYHLLVRTSSHTVYASAFMFSYDELAYSLITTSKTRLRIPSTTCKDVTEYPMIRSDSGGWERFGARPEEGRGRSDPRDCRAVENCAGAFPVQSIVTP